MPKNSEEKSLFLKLETALPTNEADQLQKFCVSRKLKARWHENPQVVVDGVFDEIQKYKGSYIGDMVHSLSGLIQNETNMSTPEMVRKHDVDRWIASVIERMLYDAYSEGFHEGSMDIHRIQQPDGDTKQISPITEEEVFSANVEKIAMLLGPKLQHICYLLAKKIKNNNSSWTNTKNDDR